LTQLSKKSTMYLDTVVEKEVIQVPKIVNYEAAKKRITQKVLPLFARKGYERLNMADVAAACNMGRTTIYQYFRNKDELFKETILYVINVIEKDIRAVMGRQDLSITEKMKILNEAWQSEFNNQNMLILILEFFLVMRREKKRMHEVIIHRIEQMNFPFRELLLGKAKERVKSKREKNEFIQYCFVMSLLEQMTKEYGNLNDGILSVISTYNLLCADA